MKYVLKQVVNLIAPYVVELFNRFLATGHFSAGFKEVVVLVLSRLDYKQRRTDRPSCLSCTPTPISAECGGADDRHFTVFTTFRPYHRRSRQPTLAARPEANPLLTYEVLKGIAPPYLGPLVRAADLQTTGSTWSPFSQHYSSGRTAKQSFYDWQSNL